MNIKKFAKPLQLLRLFTMDNLLCAFADGLNAECLCADSYSTIETRFESMLGFNRAEPTLFSLADVSRKTAFISSAKALPSSVVTLRSMWRSVLFPTNTIGTLKQV